MFEHHVLYIGPSKGYEAVAKELMKVPGRPYCPLDFNGEARDFARIDRAPNSETLLRAYLQSPQAAKRGYQIVLVSPEFSSIASKVMNDLPGQVPIKVVESPKKVKQTLDDFFAGK